MSWLVQYTWATVERTREASDLDEWYVALTRANNITGCVHAALGWAAGQLPLGLRATRSQFSELNADCPGLMCMFLVASSGMSAVVEQSRRLADVFRRHGDTSGDRFARERLLIPRHLLDSEEPLPEKWLRPTWRLAAAWFHDAEPRGRHTVTPRAGDGSYQNRVAAVDTAIAAAARRLPTTQDGTQVADALISHFPWDAAAYHWHSMVSIRTGNQAGAVDSATAAVVLQPENISNWQLLVEALRHRGDTAGAETVRRVADIVCDDGHV